MLSQIVFLTRDLSINATDQNGRTALDFARVLGNQEIISCLVQHGAEYSKHYGYRSAYVTQPEIRDSPKLGSTAAVWCRTQEEAVRNRIQELEMLGRDLPKPMSQVIEDEIRRPLAKACLFRDESNRVASVRLLSKLDKGKEERARREERPPAKLRSAMNNPYELLGVQPHDRSDLNIIRKQYHARALKYHPDKMNGRKNGNRRSFIVIPMRKEII